MISFMLKIFIKENYDYPNWYSCIQDAGCQAKYEVIIIGYWCWSCSYKTNSGVYQVIFQESINYFLFIFSNFFLPQIDAQHLPLQTLLKMKVDELWQYYNVYAISLQNYLYFWWDLPLKLKPKLKWNGK